MVTAGIGNGVDVTKTYLREEKPHIGTINTWVFINGKLTDEAFIQAMITATEYIQGIYRPDTEKEKEENHDEELLIILNVNKLLGLEMTEEVKAITDIHN